jgi:hypothetical protein
VTPDERTEYLRGLADDVKRWKFGYDVQPTHVMVKAIEVLLEYVGELEHAVVALSERLEAVEKAGPTPEAET